MAGFQMSFGGKADDFHRTTKEMKTGFKGAVDGMQNSLKAFGGALVAAFSVSAIKGWVSELITAQTELVNQAKIAGIASSELAALAYGSEQFGISQEKLADILKDTNDKVNDFLQTGGGGMADYFENIAPKVGQTAEMFRNLSGPETLGLMVKGLQEAGLTFEEMTFYMEAVASDSTALIPLLVNQAEEWQRLKAEAEQAGLILSDIESEKLKNLGIRLDVISKKLKIELGGAVVAVYDAFNGNFEAINKIVSDFGIWLTKFFADRIDAVLTNVNRIAIGIGQSFKTAADVAVFALEGMVNRIILKFQELTKWYAELPVAIGGFATIAARQIKDIDDQIERTKQTIERTNEGIQAAGKEWVGTLSNILGAQNDVNVASRAVAKFYGEAAVEARGLNSELQNTITAADGTVRKLGEQRQSVITVKGEVRDLNEQIEQTEGHITRADGATVKLDQSAKKTKDTFAGINQEVDKTADKLDAAKEAYAEYVDTQKRKAQELVDAREKAEAKLVELKGIGEGAGSQETLPRDSQNTNNRSRAGLTSMSILPGGIVPGNADIGQLLGFARTLENMQASANQFKSNWRYRDGQQAPGTGQDQLQRDLRQVVDAVNDLIQLQGGRGTVTASTGGNISEQIARGYQRAMQPTQHLMSRQEQLLSMIANNTKRGS